MSHINATCIRLQGCSPTYLPTDNDVRDVRIPGMAAVVTTLAARGLP
jgi:hypothetical protein